VVAALALLAAFTAAGVATMNLRVASRLSNVAVAENLAESVVQEAMARLQDDLGFDSPVEMGAGLDLPPDSRGYLTFDRNSGQPFSTNNFLGQESAGWQRTLPDQTAHLVGVGESGGVRRHVEVVIHLPEYPVALACAGPVQVTRSLIGSFRPEDDRPWVDGSGYSVSEEELAPGDLVTNSSAANSIRLDADSRVTGDIQTRGDVDLNGAVVGGEVRARWGQDAPLPNFNFDDFDPRGNPHTHYEELAGPLPSLSLIGNVRHQGDLSLSGDLRLDNAFLFVDGNLNVNGAVRGVGALVTTGRCQFQGTAELASNEQIALLSKGGITLEGQATMRSVFRGLLYTTGPFVARKITIVGGLVVAANQETSLAPPTVIDETNFWGNGATASVQPGLNREVFAVVPRFRASGTNLEQDEGIGFPYGVWPSQPGNPQTRTVASVLDPDDPGWRPSNWMPDDPAVLSVRWIDGQPKFRYQYWGRSTDDNPPPPGADPDLFRPHPAGGTAMLATLEFDSIQALAHAITVDNNGWDGAAVNILEDNGGQVPGPDYQPFLEGVLQYLVESRSGSPGNNFSMGPNEFIEEYQKLRILVRRTF
jgi:cytoskeletal protein CcmA (bactofilin family)